MKRIALFVIALALSFGSSAPAQTSCPADVSATIAQTCPCAPAKRHGEYMTCVEKQLHDLQAKGCQPKDLRLVAQCANTSSCGKPGKIVCCGKTNHKSLTTAEKCSSKGGRIMSGVTSLCEAKCGG